MPTNTLGTSPTCDNANTPAATTSIWASIPNDAASGDKLTTAYASSTTALNTKNDSTGWVPVNFAGVASSSSPPIAKVPIDPINSHGTNASTTLYYRYACRTGAANANNTFEIDATLESDAYTVDDQKANKDGGNSTYRYEVGTNLNLLPSYAPN